MNESEFSKIWQELLEVRRDLVNFVEFHREHVTLSAQASKTHGEAILNLFDQLEGVGKQVGLIAEQTGLLKEVIELITKQTGLISENLEQIQRVVDQNSKSLKEIKRVVDQNSLYLDSESE